MPGGRTARSSCPSELPGRNEAVEQSKVILSAAVASQLHNHPSSTLMAFCTQSPNPRGLPCQEATCLGSGRPVHTRPRPLSCNYRLYLLVRPPELRHVSQSDSGFSHPEGRACMASISTSGSVSTRPPAKPGTGLTLPPAAAVWAELRKKIVLYPGHQEVTVGPGLRVLRAEIGNGP